MTVGRWEPYKKVLNLEQVDKVVRRGTKIREGTNKQNKRTRSDAREDRDEKREEKEGILGWKRV